MFKISAQLSERGFALKTGALKANRSLYETGEETGKAAVIDNGVSALAAAMVRNTAVKPGYAVVPELRVYFTRISAGITDASYVNLIETETILRHVLKLKNSDDPQNTQILKKLSKASKLCLAFRKLIQFLS
jgi:hypothetical protein